MLISMSSQVSSNWSWFGLPSFQSIRSTKHDQISSKCSWCSLPPAHRLLPLAYPGLIFLPLLFVFITSSSPSPPPALFLLFLFFLLPTLLLLGTTACTSAPTYGTLSWSHGSGTQNNKPCFQLVNDHRWIKTSHKTYIWYLPILKMIKQLMIWIKANWVSWYIFQKDEVSTV